MSVSIFVCGGKYTRARCAECDQLAGAVCRFAFTGRLAGKFCDRYLCLPCSDRMDGYCGPHKRFVDRKANVSGAL